MSNGNLSLAILQRAHVERQDEWCPDQKPDLSFRGNELGGECGEAQNVIKKLERERHGWRGSRDTVEHLGEELADVIHCATLVAITAGIDIEKAVIAKFNSTSEKNGLRTFISGQSDELLECLKDARRLLTDQDAIDLEHIDEVIAKAGGSFTPEEQSLAEAIGLGIGGRGVAEY